MEERLKRCPTCGETLPASEFYADRTNKLDGLQAQCKVCKRQSVKARRDGKITPRAIVKQQKAMKIARSMADGNDLSEAYMSIGTTKNKTVARSCATRFINSIGEDESEMFRRMLMPPKVLNGLRDFFSDVLTRRIPVTICEFDKVANTWGKFTGTFAAERVETASVTTSAEVRAETLEAVAEMLEKNDKKTIEADPVIALPKKED